jgi:hypothetical protein
MMNLKMISLRPCRLFFRAYVTVTHNLYLHRSCVRGEGEGDGG